MHIWGDDWPYWDELYKAQTDIWNTVYRWTRCKILCKEKYGEIRYEHMFAPGSRANWACVHSPFTSHAKWGDYKRILWMWQSSWFYHTWCWLGWKVLFWKICRILKEKPYLKDELLADLSYHEKLVGKEIHNHYWNSL